MYVKIDEDGRICATTPYKEFADETYFEFDFAEDFDFMHQYEYGIIDGELKMISEPSNNNSSSVDSEQTKQSQLEDAIRMFLQNAELPEDQAVDYSLLYPKWEPGNIYRKNEYVRYNDKFYILTDNVIEADAAPDVTPYYYKEVPNG